MFKFQKKKKDKQITGNEVTIVVKTLMGGIMPRTVSKFKAIQVNDKNNNMVLESADGKFKEELDNVKHRLVKRINDRLKLKDYNKKEKITKVKEAISKQEVKLTKIVDGYYIDKEKKKEFEAKNSEKYEGEKVNFIDEELYLEDLKALLWEVENDSVHSTYEELGLNGERIFQFVKHKGILYPWKHNTTDFSLFIDIVSKRKHYVGEQDLIDLEARDELSNPFTNFFKKLMWILFIAVFIVNIIWSINLADKQMEYTKLVDEGHIQKLVDMSAGSFIKCADFFATTVGENAEILKETHRILSETEVTDKSETKSPLDTNYIDLTVREK